MSNSNKPEKKREFKTESGETFRLLPISQVDLLPFVKKLTQGLPQPPVEMIDGVAVPNEAHEDYQKALQEFELERGPYMIALTIELGLDLELDDEQQQKVDRIKKKLARINPDGLENNFDIYLYAKSVCTQDELMGLMQAITGLNNPTAQAVQDTLDSFRPDVLRPADNGHQNAPKWAGIPVG